MSSSLPAAQKEPELPDLDSGQSDSELADADNVDQQRLELPEQQGPAVKVEPNIDNLKALMEREENQLQQIENKRLQEYLAALFAVVSGLSFNPGTAFSASISNSESLLAQLSLVRQNAVEKGCG